MTSSVDNTREDPLVGFHFRVEIEGSYKFDDTYFTEVSGLGSEQEIIEHKVTKNGVEVVMKIPGRLKWQDITLKRGITSSMDIWKWRQAVEEGKVNEARANGSIILCNQQLQDVARWNFTNAWPVKISGPSIKADSNEIGIEELTLAHEYIVRES
jgi:phage tail-like protein